MMIEYINKDVQNKTEIVKQIIKQIIEKYKEIYQINLTNVLDTKELHVNDEYDPTLSVLYFCKNNGFCLNIKILEIVCNYFKELDIEKYKNFKYFARDSDFYDSLNKYKNTLFKIINDSPRYDEINKEELIKNISKYLDKLLCVDSFKNWSAKLILSMATSLAFSDLGILAKNEAYILFGVPSSQFYKKFNKVKKYIKF